MNHFSFIIPLKFTNKSYQLPYLQLRYHTTETITQVAKHFVHPEAII